MSFKSGFESRERERESQFNTGGSKFQVRGATVDIAQSRQLAKMPLFRLKEFPKPVRNGALGHEEQKK